MRKSYLFGALAVAAVAIVCYSRHTIYREMGDMEMAKYWLCRSALDDVRNAVLDQIIHETNK
jgi:hypothetical protein